MADWRKLAQEIADYDEQTARKLKRDINGVRQDLGDLLDEFAANDDTINQARLGRLLRELDSLGERQGELIYDDTTEGMRLAAKATSLFLLLNVNYVANERTLNVIDDIAMVRWVDELNLRDRSRIVGAQYSDDIRSIIRQGAYRGTNVAQIRRQVRSIYDGKEWELDRIVTSELQNTHRLQFGHTIEQNGGEWVQFNEHFPASKNRERHECYTYAREDNYGKGPGIFKVTDDKIYAPHPQCTSYLSVPNITESGELNADF